VKETMIESVVHQTLVATVLEGISAVNRGVQGKFLKMSYTSSLGKIEDLGITTLLPS
jgi:hypothetical protein